MKFRIVVSLSSIKSVVDSKAIWIEVWSSINCSVSSSYENFRICIIRIPFWETASNFLLNAIRNLLGQKKTLDNRLTASWSKISFNQLDLKKHGPINFIWVIYSWTNLIYRIKLKSSLIETLKLSWSCYLTEIFRCCSIFKYTINWNVFWDVINIYDACCITSWKALIYRVSSKTWFLAHNFSFWLASNNFQSYSKEKDSRLVLLYLKIILNTFHLNTVRK